MWKRIALAGLATVALIMPTIVPDNAVLQGTVVTPEEDDPGWNCRIHGNRVCGPLY